MKLFIFLFSKCFSPLVIRILTYQSPFLNLILGILCSPLIGSIIEKSSTINPSISGISVTINSQIARVISGFSTRPSKHLVSELY